MLYKYMNESTALTHINMGVAQMSSSLFFSDFLWQIDFSSALCSQGMLV